MPKSKNKNPTTKYKPKPSKNPQYTKRQIVDNIKSSWLWSWDKFDNNLTREINSQSSKKYLATEILDKCLFFNEKLKNNHQELRQAGSHKVSIEDLIAPAKKSLKELKLDDWDEIWSFRVSGSKQRLWVIESPYWINDTKYTIGLILWWDAEHKICPSPKR